MKHGEEKHLGSCILSCDPGKCIPTWGQSTLHNSEKLENSGNLWKIVLTDGVTGVVVWELRILSYKPVTVMKLILWWNMKLHGRSSRQDIYKKCIFYIYAYLFIALFPQQDMTVFLLSSIIRKGLTRRRIALLSLLHCDRQQEKAPFAIVGTLLTVRLF